MTKRTLSFQRETCVGCGSKSHKHPMCAIVSNNDGGFKSVPVCLACWRDPAHRTAPIKGHYFTRNKEKEALSRAGGTNIG